MDTINADMEKQKGSIIQQLRRTPLEIKILILTYALAEGEKG